MGKECKYCAHFMITSRAARDIFSIFFSTCHALKTRFELSRVKLFRNDVKGNKNYLEFHSGRFELPRVKLQ